MNIILINHKFTTVPNNIMYFFIMKGDTIMTAPEGIGMIDLNNCFPLTNADTKEGMRVLVTMTPAHPNWWDEDHKAYTCWLPELKKVGMKGDQVRY